MSKREESQRSRLSASVEGREDVKDVGEGGSFVHSSLPPRAPSPKPPTLELVDVLADVEGSLWWVWNVFPFSKDSASRIRPWRRSS